MKYASPVVELQTSNRVSQERQSTEGRTGLSRHDRGVGVPAEFLIDENPKVADVGRPLNPQKPAAGDLEVQERKPGAD